MLLKSKGFEMYVAAPDFKHSLIIFLSLLTIIKIIFVQESNAISSFINSNSFLALPNQVIIFQNCVVCNEIVDSHVGEISVISTANEIVIFSIALPKDSSGEIPKNPIGTKRK